MLELKWVFIFMAAVIVSAMLALAVDSVADSKQMEACVSSGGQWLRDSGNFYECRRL